MSDDPPNTRRVVLALVGSLLVLAAAFVVVWSSVTTSTARLSATTDGSGFFSAGTVDLTRPASTAALLFDADSLYPGRIVTSCVVIDYEGSVDADIRLHGARTGGSSLEEHIDLRLWMERSAGCPDRGSSETTETTSGADPTNPTDPDVQPLFQGRLVDLWHDHPTYADGLVLRADATEGDRLVLEAEAELVGGDEAQGLTTEFTLTVEARP